MQIKRYTVSLTGLLLLLAACGGTAVSPTPTQPPTATHQPATTAVSPAITLPPTNTAVPLSLAIATATLPPTPAPPTNTPPPIPTRTPRPPTAVPPTATPTIGIEEFTATAVDIPGGGKEVTFTWQSYGATEATIAVGTSLRFAPWQNVDPGGTTTMRLDGTVYRNPIATLTVKNEAGETATADVTIEWPCPYSYFFTPEPAACPLGPPTFTDAAQQEFENGRMLWLAVMGGDTAVYRQILVLGNDGSWQLYDDTWSSAEPRDDPSLAPPEGLSQPIRGFGKVWRTQEEVRNKLGWATGSEQGFTSMWQWRTQESIPSIAYVQLVDGRVIELVGTGSGSWSYWEDGE